MRRLVLALTLGGIGALVALCVAAGHLLRSTDMLELVMPGATNVQVSSNGMLRLRVSYDLPPSKRVQSVRQYLVYQGWRRMRLESSERVNPMFTRVRLFGIVREIVSIKMLPARRQSAELQLTRCVRIRNWIRCL